MRRTSAGHLSAPSIWLNRYMERCLPGNATCLVDICLGTKSASTTWLLHMIQYDSMNILYIIWCLSICISSNVIYDKSSSSISVYQCWNCIRASPELLRIVPRWWQFTVLAHLVLHQHLAGCAKAFSGRVDDWGLPRKDAESWAYRWLVAWDGLIWLKTDL